jgi:hypothetical protein
MFVAIACGWVLKALARFRFIGRRLRKLFSETTRRIRMPKKTPKPVLPKRPLEVRDRVMDTHGRTGTIVGGSGDKVIVACVFFKEYRRSELSYFPTEFEILACAENVQKHWTEHDEESKNQYPPGQVDTPRVETSGILARKQAKRST